VPGPEVRFGVIADAETRSAQAEQSVHVVPAAGADTAEVLAALGHSPAEVAALARSGVVGLTDDVPKPPSPSGAALTTAHAEGA
jgi:hypothetical protein